MDIVLRNVQQTQLPLIRELARVLGLPFETTAAEDNVENARQIAAAIERVESGKAELRTMDWEEFRKLAYGK